MKTHVPVTMILLFCVSVFSTGYQPTNARERATDSIIRSIRAAVKEFIDDCGAPPTTEQGLTALQVNPGLTGWDGPYTPAEYYDVFVDAWNHPLSYESTGLVFTISSAGRDGVFGTNDDQDGTQSHGTPVPKGILLILITAAIVGAFIRNRTNRRSVQEMEDNRESTRFFSVLGVIGGLACLIISIVSRSWTPLFIFASILIGLFSISLLCVLLFSPILVTMGWLAGRKKDKNHMMEESEQNKD